MNEVYGCVILGLVLFIVLLAIYERGKKHE